MVASLPGSRYENCTQPHAIKLRDLVTNRYYVGVVHATWDENLTIEMPRTARLNAGQRVQFVLVDNTSAVIPQRSMREALVQHVETAENRRVRARLTMMVGAEQNVCFS